MKVVWSDDAAWALVALEARLAQRYSSDRAARIVEELVRRVDRLADHPQLGRVVPEYGQWQLRELVDRWNRVVYRLRSDAIEVVTIVPTRMPWDERDAGDE
jgi:plasmid stabilization system protein ParE